MFIFIYRIGRKTTGNKHKSKVERRIKKKSKFLNKLQYNENTLCKMFRDFVKFELTELSVSHS